MLQIPAWLLVASLVGGSWGLWTPWWEEMLPGLGIFFPEDRAMETAFISIL